MKTINNIRLYDIEIEEFAAFLLGKNLEDFVDEYDHYETYLEEALENRYGLTLENLGLLLYKILPSISVGESPLTKKLYKGFARDNHWLVKIEVNENSPN